MSRFPDRFLDEIRARVRISTVVGRKVAWDKRKSHAARGDYWACCPFHSEDTPSFHADDGTGRYHCFGCKASGDIFTFAMEKDGFSFPEAVEMFAREAGLELPEQSQEQQAKSIRRKDLHSAMEAAQAVFAEALSRPEGDAARRYLADRGIPDDIVAAFGLGLVPPQFGQLRKGLNSKGISDELMVEAGLAKEGVASNPPAEFMRGRLTFPIRDTQGRIIAFGGRDLTGDEKAPKYLNTAETPLFSKRATLYNLDKAREASRALKRLVCVEGYFDCIACHRAGEEAAVAPLGTALTPEQLELMWRFAAEPILGFDGDAAGLKAARRAIDLALPLLKPGQSLGFVSFPDNQDPDDILRLQGAEALKARFAKPVPLIEALWQALTAESDVSTPERRAAFQAKVGEAVGSIGDEDVRTQYKSEIEARLKAFWKEKGIKPPGFKPPKPPKEGVGGGDDGGGADDIGGAIARMNERFAMVLSGQKVAIAVEDPDMADTFGRARFITLDAFTSWMGNRFIDIGRKSIALAPLWLQSKHRRQYHGVEFEPAPPGKSVSREGWYNLWRGFSVMPEPKPELAQPWLDHVFENIANGHQEHFEWIVSWFAGRIQNPRRRYGTSLVLCGGQGAGKTITGTIIGRLVPSHYLLIDDPRFVTGQFNAHLATCVFLQADESFWAGDKKSEGHVKGMITGERHMIELKGVDPFPVKNYVNLIITSNDDWVVPAAARERRFAVFNVGERHQQDEKYFGELDRLYRKPDALAALLHALMQWKVDEKLMRKIPQTDGLTKQKIESFDNLHSFAYEILAEGSPWPGSGWPKVVLCHDFHNLYVKHCERRQIGRPLAREVFGARMVRIFPTMLRKRQVDGAKRPWNYELPKLSEARTFFERHIDAVIDWGEVGDGPEPIVSPPVEDDGYG